MLKSRVMPCLQIKDGKLVKTVNFENPNYVGDPVNAVKIYNDKEVDELILIDIDATNRRIKDPDSFKIDTDKIRSIASECFMPLAYGGGIEKISDMAKIFEAGAEKIIVSTSFLEHPDNIREASSHFGSQSIVVSLDVKKIANQYKVFTRSGNQIAKTPDGKSDPISFAKLVENQGAGEIFLHFIDTDGTFQGFDANLIEQVTKAVNIPVIVCGGAGSTKDFTKAVKVGVSAIAIGSMAVYLNNNTEGVLINFPSKAEIEEALKGVE